MCLNKILLLGNSLAVQWLGFSTFMTRTWVQSLVRELRSHKPHVQPINKQNLTFKVIIHRHTLPPENSLTFYDACWKSVAGISSTLSPQIFQSYIVLLSFRPTGVQLFGSTFTPVWGSQLTHLHLCHPLSSPPLGHTGFLLTLGTCHAFIHSLNKSSLSPCQGPGSVLGAGDTVMSKTSPYPQELPLQENRCGYTNYNVTWWHHLWYPLVVSIVGEKKSQIRRRRNRWYCFSKGVLGRLPRGGNIWTETKVN